MNIRFPSSEKATSRVVWPPVSCPKARHTVSAGPRAVRSPFW